jgi:tetratricopeptide (TPR) repeat protein
MISSILLVASLALSPGHDDSEWLSRLKLPKLVDISVNLLFTDEMLGVEPFELGFPEDPEEKLRDAKKRLDAGEAPARLLHQAALGFLELKEYEKAMEALNNCLGAYQQEIEIAPDDFDLRMSCALAFKSAGHLSWNQVCFEEMQKQFLAAAEKAPDEWRPGFHCARAQWERWWRGRAIGDKDDTWLDQGILRAEEAIEADSTAAGGHWWRFFLTMMRVMMIESDESSEVQQQELADAVSELLDACDEVEHGDRLRFAAHFYGASLEISVVVKGDENWEEEEGLELISLHGEGLLKTVHCFADDDEVLSAAALMYWTSFCLSGDEGDWEKALKRATKLELSEEKAFGMATYAFHRRDRAEAAAMFAALLEEAIESDEGRAFLVPYRFKLDDFEGALEILGEFDEVTPDTEIQRGVLLLLAGQREAALELLEKLAADRDDEGNLYHALGVGRALDGKLEAAVKALEVAVSLLEDSDGAEETLEEVRGLLEDSW